MPEPYNSCSIENALNHTNISSSIAVTGSDSFEFLQGQLTNDLQILEKRDSLLSAWCNPKGRVISLMTVTVLPDGYALSVPADLTDELIKRLTMFRFRSKVEFNVDDEISREEATFGIENGIPWIGAEQSEKFTPHMLNLDLLDAINLDKGCYTGQEIVARTHYKGATKRRTLRFESDISVSAGDDVLAGDRKIGEVLNAAGSNCLAVVAVDKIDVPLVVQDSKLTLIPLAYLDIA
jgi:folate-binding protein YgfZ